MKHVKMVTKKSQPSQAYVWDWFVDLKTVAAVGPGIITTGGKAAYINELADTDGSIDPNAV